MRSTLAAVLALLPVLIAGPASAQNRAVRPYFLVIVDTSGSMTDTVDPPPTCAGYQNNKMGHAKCALTKIINATGDADFGLMQFSKPSGNTTCGEPVCGITDASSWLRVPIETNNTIAILNLIDNVGAGPVDELCAGGHTPIGGALTGAREYFQGNLPLDVSMPAGAKYPAPTVGDAALACRPLSVILLTDGDECCAGCSNTGGVGGAVGWSGCPKTHAAFPAITCPTTCFTGSSSASPTCTGANQAFENAPDRAYELLHETTVPGGSPKGGGIHTYAIGFGLPENDPHIEHIATAGETDNPKDGAGGLRGFYATDEATLSKAFSQIIADAQPPSEICNNLDDDCDMLIDEGIPKYCDIPHGITDKTLCAPPAETVCDGKDDNCNGVIDEGVLNACGTCGDVPPEVCDGMDNDCDGSIDEDIPGGACGKDVGICKPGNMRCIAGMNECTGGVGPQPEACNCKDDDCDTFVDEDPDNTLCPGGKCIGCVCVPHCGMDQEFMASCPDGQRADFQPSGECFCIKDDCDAKECGASTQMRDDEVACAPDGGKVAPCLCRAGMCVARCDGVSCAAGQVCNKRNGRCVANNCHGLGCESGELCEPVSGTCMKDACADAGCKTSEVCRDGQCEPSCAAVHCDDGQRCQAGKCVMDVCFSVSCSQGKGCDPETGKCVDDQCSGITCGDGLACSLSSGECERDPCFGVRCPGQQTCSNGECRSSTTTSTGESPSHGIGSDPNARVIAAGGGGCSCRVAASGPAGRGQAAWALSLMLGLALLLRRRRVSGRRWLAFGVLLGAWPLSGCRVDPFCIDCVNPGHSSPDLDSGFGNPPDGAARDSGHGGQDADTNLDAGDDAATEGGTHVPPCKDPMPEICNGKDDDCDFKVDEDTVAAVNDCDQSGICAGTNPICVNGDFTCRYPDQREMEETLCDGKDNDCDGRVDETFTLLDKPCDLGIGACKVTGKEVCNLAGDAVLCVATSTIDPTDEVCDGIDNDCDGMIDEPHSNPGSSPSFVTDDVIQVSSSLWVYKYEASRPDAMSDAQGIIGTRACSRVGVLPWTNLTYSEALAACQAADMDLCQSCAVGDDASGDGDHCSGNDWRTICEGSGTCAWSYTPSGGSCPTGASASYPASGSACNGHDQSAQPGGADNDALATTGSLSTCFTHVQGGDVFDMSGNAKEWTKGPHSPDSNPLRGGSYNNLPGGMRCDFNFNVAADNVRLPNVGFRCCSAAQP